VSEPIVYAATWRKVMTAAGFRCQCTGACGNPHHSGAGRCPREHDRYASKRRGPIRLTAAPADPATPAQAAARLPVAALRAWCSDCRDGAARAARRTARTTPGTSQDGLFTL
jgi:hypothetical protein